MPYVLVVEHHSGTDRPRGEAKEVASRNVTAGDWPVAFRVARNSGASSPNAGPILHHRVDPTGRKLHDVALCLDNKS
jgi:hypothetical protein